MKQKEKRGPQDRRRRAAAAERPRRRPTHLVPAAVVLGGGAVVLQHLGDGALVDALQVQLPLPKLQETPEQRTEPMLLLPRRAAEAGQCVCRGAKAVCAAWGTRRLQEEGRAWGNISKVLSFLSFRELLFVVDAVWLLPYPSPLHHVQG